jgi:cell division protease FtsH
MLLPILLLVGLWIAQTVLSATAAAKTVSYTELVSAVTADRVERAEVDADEIVADLRARDGLPRDRIMVRRIPNMDERPLLEAMQSHGVIVAGRPAAKASWSTYLWLALPALLLLLFFGATRAAFGGMPGAGPFALGRSRAKVYDRSKENPVTFADVAGVDEAKAELAEIIGFLREPERYRAIGARAPKGVLLVGAPGTGKTLLARAVAGEANVPFYSISGSEFVEMIVGVGASRVRDLFEQAKAHAPCIVFIDELDAVGKARSVAMGFAANEEREQTLNQLLVEMDGFDPSSGIVVMAATNRPEILDRALLRAGRFDRQVLVDRPDVRGREAILRVHVRKVKLGVSVDLRVIAQRTPGMVGADLANVVNEAALASVRRGSSIVDAQDFEEAIDRLQLGLKKEGRVMTEDEKRRVALHEAGHALVALMMKHGDPVHRVTIIPRSIGALGATLQLPTEERYMMTREELRDRICILLAGRVAEEIASNDVSTGAEDDLEKATELARHMVCRFGMSDAVGPLSLLGGPGSRFLAARGERPDALADETSRLVDREIRAIVDAEHERARAELTEHRRPLDAIAAELIAHETLQRADLEAIVARTKRPLVAA